MNVDELTELYTSLDAKNLALDALDGDMPEIYRTGRPFVSIEQFITDPYYMGKVGKALYPGNIPDLVDIFNPSKQYIEVILSGATSIGKTFMAAMAMTYMIALIGNYNDPHTWLGGSPASPLIMINMSISEKKAKEVVYTRVKTMVDSSPYFREQFPRDTKLVDTLVWRLSKDPKDIMNRTGPQIMFKPGTGDSLSALGDDIYAGIGDELNFFRVVEKSKRAFGEAFDPAQRLYDVVGRRMKGRFSAGGLPLGKFFLLSSAQYPDDFIERRIREADEAGDLGKTVKVIRKSLWEAKKGVFVGGKPVFSDRTFRVEVGTSRRGSRLLDKYNKQTGEMTVGTFEDIEGKVLNVPIELWDDFYRDIEGSVRDFGGEVTRAISPFFQTTDPIYAAVDLGRAEGLAHPWTREETTLEDASYLDMHAIAAQDPETGKWKPKRHPRAYRYAHVDLAISGDSAGLVIVHVADWKTIMMEGKERMAPIFEVDLALRINPPVGGEIKFSKVREIFYALRNYGMQFHSITYDSFQSTDSLQELESRGFPADKLSVDKDISPYIYLRDTIMDGRLRMYFYDRLVIELGRLEKKADKIDHPASGSKDVSDALAGAVWTAMLTEATISPDMLAGRMPIVQHKEKPMQDPRREQASKDLKSMEDEFREFIGGSRIVRRGR